MQKTKRCKAVGRRSNFRSIALVAMLLAFLCRVATAGDFDAANQAYDQNKFSEAKGGYEKLIESRAGSANIYYNLGNTDFRLGSAGRAILNYERALALSPRHPEAQANLKLLREQNGSKLLPQFWNTRLAAFFSEKVWTITSAAAAWVTVFGLAGILLRKEADNFALWMLVSFSGVVCAVAFFSVWTVSKNQALAVITAKQTEARLAPAASAGVAEALTAGSQVRVLSERGEWVYCELPGQGRGWIPEGAVERVRPAKS